MSLKMKSIFAVRPRPARTAEFWDCKAYFDIPRKYDVGYLSVLSPVVKSGYFRTWK